MRATLIQLVGFSTVLSVCAAISLPVIPAHAAVKQMSVKQTIIKKKTQKPSRRRVSISAKPGADEKKFKNATSRCLTRPMKALHQQALRQMQRDVETFGAGHPTASEQYKTKLATVWSAMEQPYCGFGSRGVSAVKKSFLKSINRIRAEFLAEVKRGIKASS